MKSYNTILDLAKNMDKVYLNLDEDGNHEYTLTLKRVDDGIVQYNEYSLYYSNSEIWTSQTKGKLAIRMTNDGKHFIFSKLLKKQMEHYEGFHIKLLLNFETMMEENEPKKNFIDYEEICKTHMKI